MTGAASGASPRRILIVDDYAAILSWASRSFRAAGWNVESACDGRVALARWTQLVEAGCRPDVVLTDAALPVISGATLARRLREQSPTVPIIVMHGQALNDAEWAGTLQAFAVSVPKPVSAGVLLDAAARLTTRQTLAA